MAGKNYGWARAQQKERAYRLLGNATIFISEDGGEQLQTDLKKALYSEAAYFTEVCLDLVSS